MPCEPDSIIGPATTDWSGFRVPGYYERTYSPAQTGRTNPITVMVVDVPMEVYPPVVAGLPGDLSFLMIVDLLLELNSTGPSCPQGICAEV